MSTNHTVSSILKQKYLWIILIILGILVKYSLLPVKTGDYIGFLEPWLAFIKSHGYFSSLKYNFYDYTPSYIYILVIIAKIGLNPLFSAKIVSIIFEFVAAFFIGKIAYLKYKNNLVILIAMAVVPFLPSVILNSSYLSQCDSIYASFVIGSIYFILNKKQFLSIVFLGIAFAFKMQTVFILPFFFVLMLRGKIYWYYFLLLPIMFFISLIPAWAFGRPILDLLNVYIAQTDHYQLLTLNFPNPYIFISNDFYQPVKLAGMIFTVMITLFCGFWLKNKKYNFTLEHWIRLAFLSSIIIPFVLPGMHERYMYLGDVLGVLYFLIVRKNIHLPLGIILVSFYSYIRCSRYNDILPMEPALIIYFLVIIFVCLDFVKSLNSTSNETAE